MFGKDDGVKRSLLRIIKKCIALHFQDKSYSLPVLINRQIKFGLYASKNITREKGLLEKKTGRVIGRLEQLSTMLQT